MSFMFKYFSPFKHIQCLTISDESVCSDIKLETEADDGTEIPTRLPVNMYHARRALKNAIADWLPEFHRNRQASGVF